MQLFLRLEIWIDYYWLGRLPFIVSNNIRVLVVYSSRQKYIPPLMQTFSLLVTFALYNFRLSIIMLLAFFCTQTCMENKYQFKNNVSKTWILGGIWRSTLRERKRSQWRYEQFMDLTWVTRTGISFIFNFYQKYRVSPKKWSGIKDFEEIWLLLFKGAIRWIKIG